MSQVIIEKLDAIEAKQAEAVAAVEAKIPAAVEAVKAEVAEMVSALEAKVAAVQAPAVVREKAKTVQQDVNRMVKVNNPHPDIQMPIDRTPRQWVNFLATKWPAVDEFQWWSIIKNVTQRVNRTAKQLRPYAD